MAPTAQDKERMMTTLTAGNELTGETLSIRVTPAGRGWRPSFRYHRSGKKQLSGVASFFDRIWDSRYVAFMTGLSHASSYLNELKADRELSEGKVTLSLTDTLREKITLLGRD